MTTFQKRIAGGFWGLLVGDALGVPYEFHRAAMLPPSEQIEMQPPAGFIRAHQGIPAGTWSDDGAQALALLDSLLQNDRLDLNHFARQLIAWYEKGLWAVDNHMFDVGIQTADAIRALKHGTPPEQAGFIKPNGKGNGALMRVLPLALWHTGTDEQLVEDAHRQSLVTHGHLTNQVCCALYCLWARGLLRGLEQGAAYQAAVHTLRTLYAKAPEYREELETTVRPDSDPYTDGSGYVVYTLNCARLAMREVNFENAVKAAIAYGEDTDTNAAVVGGLMGVALGADAIPARWMEKMRGREVAEPLLERLLCHAKSQIVSREISE